MASARLARRPAWTVSFAIESATSPSAVVSLPDRPAARLQVTLGGLRRPVWDREKNQSCHRLTAPMKVLLLMATAGTLVVHTLPGWILFTNCAIPPPLQRTAAPLRNQHRVYGSHLSHLKSQSLYTTGIVTIVLSQFLVHLNFLFRPHYASSPLSHSGSNPSDYASYASSTGLPQDLSTTYSGRSSTSSAGLFDPRQPNLPNPNLMAHLLGVFCNNFERNFPFLQYEDLSRRLYNNSLSPILANSIAAISSRYAPILTFV